MLKLSNIFIILISVLCLSSCSSTTQLKVAKNKIFPIIPINQSLFEHRESEVISPNEIFKLSKIQETEFLKFYAERLDRGEIPHEIIYAFMEERFSGFTYYGDTLIAEEAYRLRKGNCMSLTIPITLQDADFSKSKKG